MRLLPVMCSSAPSADTTLQKALESFYEAFISDDPRDGQSRFGYALWRATEMLTVPQAKYFTAKAKHHVAADQMPVAS